MSSNSLSDRRESAPDAGEYVVVARRYRPQNFDELIGQQHVARALKGAIESGRIGHAYLFTGARGVGKTSAARILAKALNCQTGPTTTPCNQCDTCLSVSGGDDVDVLEIDGASNRGIDEIRQLRQNVGVRPSRSRFKVYIIDEVHMLTKDAFNALLKTLEEPPEHVKFIFATTEPNKIPITILSRCQRFDFAGIDVQQVSDRLQQIVQLEGVQAAPDALQLIARRGSGSMRDSQSLLEQLMATGSAQITTRDVHVLLGMAPAERLSRIMACLISKDTAAAFVELDQALSEGVEVGQLLEQLLGCFRDAMAAAVGCSAEQFLYVAPDRVDEIVQIGQQLGVETLLAMVQVLEQTVSRLRVSLHARILAELALVRLCKLDDLDELSQLIAQMRNEQDVDRDAKAPPKTAQASKAPKKNGSVVANRANKDRPAGDAGSTAQPILTSPSGNWTPDLAAELWNKALGQLTEATELVADQASFYQSVANIAPNHLVVTFPAKYTSCKSFCERPDQKARLEQTLSELAGSDLRIEFKTAAAADDGDGPVEPVTKVRSQRQLQIEVGGRPFVRRAVELFGASQLRIDPPNS